MYSGCPLVVDNRGGWKHIIQHGYNGFLCHNTDDFIKWSSILTKDYNLRTFIANNALKTIQEYSSSKKSSESWSDIFNLFK